MTATQTITCCEASTVLSTRRPPLDAIFAPRSIAVIGATESAGSVGSAIMRNLAANFRGTIFPINPKRDAIMQIKAYPSVRDVPGEIDLAVIATPAATVPQIIRDCAAARVPGAIVISAGFKETGPTGAALEQEVLAEARRSGMRIIGPNCLGVMNPHVGLNATFANAIARPGSVAFLSQSGALCTAILDWSLREKLGFSAFVSVGSMLDVGWGDLVDYLGDDPRTKSIVLYMESIGNARPFLSAAREVALSKPIIIIKVGRTAAAGKAAASHTGALTGSDEVLDAAFNRVGALRVNTIAELFDMVDVLARQPRPAGPRLTIITNAGGPGVLATDMLITSGGDLAPLSPESHERLDRILPPQWSRGNPIDILGDAGSQRYADAVEIAAANPDSDGTLMIFTPQAMSEPVETAKKIAAIARTGKPILASWMGGESVAEAKQIIQAAGIPDYDYPDAAARAFTYMWRHSSNLNALYETPTLVPDDAGIATCASLEEMLRVARSAGRTILNEFSAKCVLEAYGIPTNTTAVARTVDEAVDAAERLGYPAVLKLLSDTITHKTDVGGVKLQLVNADAVRAAYLEIEQNVAEKAGKEHFQGVTVQPMIRRGGYEIIFGSSVDPQFGPVLLFGTGGELVEVFKDRALGLPPLNTTLALRMMEQTKIYRALRGVRGRKAVDLEALARYLVRFSQLVVEQPWIKEIDINPLLVSSDGITALDARVVLFGSEVSDADLPKPAIRPYPVQYVSNVKIDDGSDVTIRPIRPEDEPMMIAFHRTLSEETVRERYFGTFKLEERIAHQRLRRICFNDFDRDAVLVAEAGGKILGVGRLSKIRGEPEAEFAVVIGTPWQNKGLGSALLKQLIDVARAEKLTRIFLTTLADNRPMIHLCRKHGFDVQFDKDQATCSAQLAIQNR